MEALPIDILSHDAWQKWSDLSKPDSDDNFCWRKRSTFAFPNVDVFT